MYSRTPQVLKVQATPAPSRTSIALDRGQQERRGEEKTGRCRAIAPGAGPAWLGTGRGGASGPAAVCGRGFAAGRVRHWRCGGVRRRSFLAGVGSTRANVAPARRPFGLGWALCSS
ncbi:hypothetical protein CDD83_6014 [Cordyceps sp. RAO-2017]|nr:hypothetical protein CDD83_6014 [Cordyceps sp. RAO-2017]